MGRGNRSATAEGLQIVYKGLMPAADQLIVSPIAMNFPPCPLLFTYRDTVFGNGYVAEVVATNGRALVVQEDGESWFYGVNPGGIAAPGESPDAAHAAFRATFRRALNDFAAAATTFEEFRAEAERFFGETNEPTAREWDAAVETVRAGEIRPEGIPQKPAASPRSISVLIKHGFSARDNEAQLERAIAA